MKSVVASGVLLISVLTFACNSFEYSPNQVFDRNSQMSLNRRNLAWLDTLPQDDTVTIAFVGDSQRFYDEIDLFIDTVNNLPAIDFVILAGDISDFGLLTEFELVHQYLEKMNKPYIGVIGNHDVVTNGDEVFKRMYGPLDFSFIYHRIKFVCHNTNSKEFNNGQVPNIPWLASQLQSSDSVDYFIPVSHVPPFSSDFDEKIVGPYTELFRESPGLLASLHAHIHIHQDTIPYNDGIRYLTSNSFDKRSFVLLKIINGEIYKSMVDY